MMRGVMSGLGLMAGVYMMVGAWLYDAPVLYLMGAIGVVTWASLFLPLEAMALLIPRGSREGD